MFTLPLELVAAENIVGRLELSVPRRVKVYCKKTIQQQHYNTNELSILRYYTANIRRRTTKLIFQKQFIRIRIAN
jgi:hypothetical protein